MRRNKQPSFKSQSERVGGHGHRGPVEVFSRRTIQLNWAWIAAVRPPAVLSARHERMLVPAVPMGEYQPMFCAGRSAASYLGLVS